MKAGDVTVTIRVVDEATPVLDRIAWKIMAVDGQWHREMMRADGLPKPIWTHEVLGLPCDHPTRECPNEALR